MPVHLPAATLASSGASKTVDRVRTHDIVLPWRYTTDLIASDQEKIAFLGQTPSSASDIAAENRGVPNVAAPCVNLTLQRADGFERQPKAAAISNVRRQSQ